MAAIACIGLGLVASTGGAAQNYQFVYEGEYMAVPATGTSVGRDVTASGGMRLGMWTSRTVTTFVPGAVRSVSLRVKADLCEGGPDVRLSLDGKLVGERAITSTDWETVTFSFTPTEFATQHVMSISYPNDFSTAACDRNLFLDRAVVDTDLDTTPRVPATTAPIEAETRSLTPSTSGKVVDDVFATGDKAQMIWANGSVSMGTSDAIAAVTVRVRGDQCAGAPKAELVIDDVIYATVDVYWTGWATHQVTLPTTLSAGSHTVTVRYPNDRVLTGAACDRNLFVDYLGVNVPASYLRPPPIEAEGLSVVPATSGGSINDPTASSEKARMLWSNARVDTTITSGVWNVVARVRGAQCEGAPQAVISVDGKPISTFEVWWTDWETVPVKLATPLPAGRHTISVAYTNDAAFAACDRALRVDWLGANLDGVYLTPAPVKPVPKPTPAPYNGGGTVPTPVPAPAPTSAPAPTTGGRPKLRWAPPALSNPVTLSLGTGETYVQLDDQTDYIIKFPNAMKNATTLKGGRNIVVIGGLVRQQRGGSLIRALFIDGAVGTVHIEGLTIDSTGGGEGDGIAIRAPRATVQIQNTRVVGVLGSEAGQHGDIIQPFGGVNRLRVHRMTGSTNYQGLFLRPDTAPIGSIELHDVDLDYNEIQPSEGGDLLWLTTDCKTARVTMSEVYLGKAQDGRTSLQSIWPRTTDPSCPARLSGSGASASVTWPTLPVTGSVKAGKPSTGSFVPPSASGLNYTSPGYW